MILDGLLFVTSTVTMPNKTMQRRCFIVGRARKDRPVDGRNFERLTELPDQKILSFYKVS